MRKSLFILLCLSMSYSLMAQEIFKQQEIGLAFSNLDNFGFTYKVGTNKSLWRFNTLLISGNNNENSNDSSLSEESNTGLSFAVGKEYRKNITYNLELRYGADVSFGYSKSKSDFDDKTPFNLDTQNERTIFEPGINAVFGFNYLFGQNMILGAEVLPSFTYTTGESVTTDSGVERKTDISGVDFGLSNTSVLLTFAYRL